ncbi:protein FAR1-RELATED SEQUENCE 8-like [Fagus crenata]
MTDATTFSPTDHALSPCPDLHISIEEGSQNSDQLLEHDDDLENDHETEQLFEIDGNDHEGNDLEVHDLENECEQLFEIEGNDLETDRDDTTIVDYQNGISERKDYPPPIVGMEFESYDDAYNYYNCYAKELGFAIRVKSSWTKRNSKEKRGAVLCCNCEGFKTIKEANSRRKETRTGCLAMIRLRLVESNRWRVDEVKLEHNHSYDPERAQNSKSHKKMVTGDKRKVEPTVDVEVRTIKLYRTPAVDAMGYGSSNSNEGETNNHVDRSRRLKLKTGDAQVIYDYFCRVQLTDPNFFYVMDLNDEGHLRNVFWIDSRSRAAYEVFPRAHHRFCLPLVMQSILDNLGEFQEYEAFQTVLRRTVYDSIKVDEFEMAWEDMIQRFGVREHEWLRILYEDRERWVPVYSKDTSFAGMSSSEMVGTVSAFFDGYVYQQTSLKEFFHMYELILQKKHQKEALDDLESRDSSAIVKTSCYYELQLSKLYTKEIFQKFQDEVVMMSSCFNITQAHTNGPVITYMVKERDGEEILRDVRNFEVMYDKAVAEVRCICSCFNFKGYLCRHALCVLDYNGVEEIPFQYILPRWRMDFKRLYVPDHGSNNVDITNPVQWFDHLYRRAMQVVEEGMISQDHYMVAWQAFKESLNKSLTGDSANSGVDGASYSDPNLTILALILAHISAAIVDPRSTLDIKPSTYKPILYLVKPPAPVGLGFPISKPSVLSLDQAEDGGFPKDDRHSNCTIPGSPLHSHFKMEEASLSSEQVPDSECNEIQKEEDGVMTELDYQNGLSEGRKEFVAPAVGMEFESYDDAYNYYNCYAKEMGFRVRVKNSWFKRNSREKYGAVLCCSSQGFKRIKDVNRLRKETRTGCPAMIRMRLVDSKRWRVLEVTLEHNHLLGTKIYKSIKKMGSGTKRKSESNSDAEVRTIKLYRALVIDAGGNGGSNSNAREVGNFTDHPNQLNLKKEFLDKYELALHKKHKEEVLADIESRSSSPLLKTRCSFELQLSKVYTREIFKKFQYEVEEMYSCFSTTQLHIDGPIIIFLVKERVLGEGNRREIRDYEVLYNRTASEVRCICSCFNFYGYLCRHALCVLNFNGVEEVPPKYILSRWKKDYKRLYIPDIGSGSVDATDRVQWFNQLYRSALQVVEEGVISLDHYKVALQAFEESLNRVHDVDGRQALPAFEESLNRIHDVESRQE